MAAESARFVLGLDAGNTVIKAVLFDLEGRKVSACAIHGQSATPEPGAIARRVMVFRPPRRSWCSDLLAEAGSALRDSLVGQCSAFGPTPGGLLIAIGAATAALARMRAEKRSPFYRIGTAPGVEFATEGAPDG